MLPAELKNYDFILAQDSSGSMSRPGTNGKVTRWKESQETGYALATKMSEFDSDGIDVIRFGGNVEVFQGVTPAKVDEVYAKDPQGGTPLHLVIREARKLHEARRSSGDKKGTILAVITDGVPDDAQAVEQEIISLSNSLQTDDDFGITLLQVGNDAEATKYLKNLDDNLQGKGAKFDIVDTKTFEELNGMSLTDALIASLTD